MALKTNRRVKQMQRTQMYFDEICEICSFGPVLCFRMLVRWHLQLLLATWVFDDSFFVKFSN